MIGYLQPFYLVCDLVGDGLFVLWFLLSVIVLFIELLDCGLFELKLLLLSVDFTSKAHNVVKLLIDLILMVIVLLRELGDRALYKYEVLLHIIVFTINTHLYHFFDQLHFHLVWFI
jgi:hypothetical protein